jgi:malate dehydrogenase (oxaloacetate-decarboxylating)
VNNSIGFPAIFRGVLDVGAKTITDDMCVVAAQSLAKYAEKRGMNEDNIVPTMGEPAAFVQEAVDVGMEAQKEGIAFVKISAQDLGKKVESMINGAKASHDALVKAGCILPAVTD